MDLFFDVFFNSVVCFGVFRKVIQYGLESNGDYHIILGIDPGQNGGIAKRTRDGLDVFKMPETEKDLYDLLLGFPELFTHCFLEKQGARPMQGAPGMWKFAEHYGNLRMALTAQRISYELVLPNTWQKALGCQTGGDKKITYRKAQEMFPNEKITHWKADAMLIAEYGWRKTIGTINQNKGETK